MEIESPPDKQDLLRLRDEYGRGGKGYENVGEYARDVSQYEYIDFHGRGREDAAKILKGVEFRFHRLRSEKDCGRFDHADVVAVSAGELRTADGTRKLASGDVCRGWELHAQGYGLSHGEAEVLSLAPGITKP